MEDEGEKEGGQHGEFLAAKLPFFSFTQKMNKLGSLPPIVKYNIFILFGKFHRP
jgi:hypothetical protein